MNQNIQCPVCNDAFTESSSSITCSDCGSRYHTGKCAGINANTIKKKGEVYRKSWRCPACRRTESQPRLSQKPSDKPEGQDICAWLKNINDKLDQLLSLKETVESIEDTIQFLSDTFDDLQVRVKKKRTGCRGHETEARKDRDPR